MDSRGSANSLGALRPLDPGIPGGGRLEICILKYTPWRRMKVRTLEGQVPSKVENTTSGR